MLYSWAWQLLECCPVRADHFVAVHLDALQHWTARVYGRIILAAVWLQGVE